MADGLVTTGGSGILTLPAEVIPAVQAFEGGSIEPAFVPLAIATEPKSATNASPIPGPVEITSGIVTVEIGAGLVMRVPGDVAVDRVAALVRAMRGTA